MIYDAGISSLLGYYAEKEHPGKILVAYVPKVHPDLLFDNVIRVLPFDTMQEADHFMATHEPTPENLFYHKPFIVGKTTSIRQVSVDTIRQFLNRLEDA